jgi:hypothetical protein
MSETIEETRDEMADYNWISLLVGGVLLVAGFIALALGSITFAPLCIVTAYVTMIMALAL